VHAGRSGADVVTSLSLMEWFVNFYKEAQEGAVAPVEGVVGAGDVIFVPRGWWHMAINLEETVAVTQVGGPVYGVRYFPSPCTGLCNINHKMMLNCCRILNCAGGKLPPVISVFIIKIS
jgi:hypothetical protein